VAVVVVAVLVQVQLVRHHQDFDQMVSALVVVALSLVLVQSVHHHQD
jgi:hypothetical protein